MEYEYQLRILSDVLIATVLTALVGMEREKAHKPAGMRTNMIVGGASCLLVAVTMPLIEFIEVFHVSEIIATDPVRLLHALVVGISFIGAGTVIKSPEKFTVKGLTTAATLLYSTGIGICVGIRLYILAIGVTVLIIVINFLINLLEKKFFHSN